MVKCTSWKWESRPIFAIVKAKYGDTRGNLIYNKTANNFNQAMATAGKITIAEVEELVPYGMLDANQIHTPGIYCPADLPGCELREADWNSEITRP